ncbi:conserved hypothetical protein [Candidatus Desulfarcum epimagneticum]|uniref:HEPN domain-containing protein n=1 Tax=uncultured Desulfobacteraceae bacterium TaxID=218296 RepID=A0A484HIM0_9BACT|nr:conserved hypothetical protein [uncultured Desulfobacteraceae bacterium]
MSDYVKDLVNYRLGRAKETIEDAKLMANAGSWNNCVNRLYYACFYAVSALLTQQGLSASKHTGVRSLFNLNFVKTGKIEKKMSRLYNDLFEKRQEGDYVDFVYFSEPQIMPLIPKAEKFIEKIKELLAI